MNYITLKFVILKNEMHQVMHFLTGYCENICFNEKKSILIFFLNIKLYLKKQKQNWQSNSCSFFFSPNKFFQL